MCKYCEIKAFGDAPWFSVDVLNDECECEGGVDVAICHDPDAKKTPYYLTICMNTKAYSMTDSTMDDCAINYCPMCGKPLHSFSEPINEPEYYYLVRDDCGEYSVYDNERMAREFAEEVASNVGVAELIRAKVDTINTCEVRSCWDDE